MGLTKSKVAAALLLLGVVFGGGAAALTRNAPAAERAAPAEEARKPPAENEEETALPVDQAVVHRLERFGGEMREFLDTPGGAVVASNTPGHAGSAAFRFLESRDLAGKGRLTVNGGLQVSLLAAGPVVNGPDVAKVRKLVRHGDRLELEVIYTDVAAEGVALKQNTRCVHLVQAPLDLPAGTYYLTVVWRPVPSGQGTKPLTAEPRRDTRTFEVTAGRVNESKPVEVNGLRFQAVAEETWTIPEPGKSAQVNFGLRVTNRTERTQQFDLFQSVYSELRLPGEKKWLLGAVYDGPDPGPRPLAVPAGRTDYLCGRATLVWNDQTGLLQMNWQDGRTPGHYILEVPQPGRCQLRFQVHATRPKSDKPNPVLWEGKAETADVVFEVKPAPLAGDTDNRLKNAAWEALADGEGVKSHWAVWTLAGSPKEALPFLGERLKPATERLEPKRVERLIAQLGDEGFEVRERASLELEKMGELVISSLKAARAKADVDPEIRGRLIRILERLEKQSLGPARRRGVRALEVLEQINTPEARRLVEELTKGTPEDPVTIKARECLTRMSRR